MTISSGKTIFSRIRPVLALLGVCSGLAVSACTSIDAADLAEAERRAQTRSGAPTDTGTYPNLNIAPPPTAPQFGDDEKAQKLAALEAAQRGQKPGQTGESPEARIKRLQLLADKQANTLNVIENK